MEASTSRNPQGLSRPVMGLLYLFIKLLRCKKRFILKEIVGFLEAIITGEGLARK